MAPWVPWRRRPRPSKPSWLVKLCLFLPIFATISLLWLCARTVFREKPHVRRGVGCHVNSEMPPPMRVFVHLHKTAGNNLKGALGSFARNNRLRAWHTCHRARSDSIWERLYFFRKPKLQNATDCDLYPFSQLGRPNRRAFDLVFGHQYVGVHTLVRPRQVQYFTFLRHPLARKVSHFAHFEYDDERHQLLIDYLLHANRNYQTKRLAGGAIASDIANDARSRLVDVSKHAGYAALSAAIQNLDKRFFFVGIHERYAEGLCVLASMLNNACWARTPNGLKRPLRWQSIAHNRMNVHPRSAKLLDSLPRNIIRATLVMENLDVQLYEHAKKRFESMIARYPQCLGVE